MHREDMPKKPLVAYFARGTNCDGRQVPTPKLKRLRARNPTIESTYEDSTRGEETYDLTESTLHSGPVSNFKPQP